MKDKIFDTPTIEVMIVSPDDVLITSGGNFGNAKTINLFGEGEEFGDDFWN